jgi:hypothetical protein
VSKFTTSPLREAKLSAVLQYIEYRNCITLCSEYYRRMNYHDGLTKAEVNAALDDLSKAGKITIEAKNGAVWVRAVKAEGGEE